MMDMIQVSLIFPMLGKNPQVLFRLLKTWELFKVCTSFRRQLGACFLKVGINLGK